MSKETSARYPFMHIFARHAALSYVWYFSFAERTISGFQLPSQRQRIVEVNGLELTTTPSTVCFTAFMLAPRPIVYMKAEV